MDLDLNGIKVSISETEIAAVMRRHLLAEESPALKMSGLLPAIGADFDGGLYAGLTLYDGQPHALVLLPGECEAADWKYAIGWAEEHNGTLPSRIDQLVLWQNLKGQFKEAWYWSCEIGRASC